MCAGSSVEPSSLSVSDLHMWVGASGKHIVRGVSFDIPSGSAFGLVGESGSGKSMTIRTLMGLQPRGSRIKGRATFEDADLLNQHSWKARRRKAPVAMVFQDPTSSLNPLLTVGDAIAQVCRSHGDSKQRAARTRSLALLTRVGIRDPEESYRAYPHQFSGGMRQRVLIAMALAVRPRLLLADEPTTALDVVVQAGILRLLDGIRREESMSLVLVSHDFAIVAGMCERVGVMYAGELLEDGPVREVLFRPRHPYTQALLRSVPENNRSGRLPSIRGAPPDLSELSAAGCSFAPRCDHAVARCHTSPIALVRVRPGHAARCVFATDDSTERVRAST